jgi:3-deoxy-D-manno-octulosonate 8-phosphate phosphatase (KDO 8-P phosphatase)
MKQHLIELAKPIKLLIFDVDGILTSGTLYLSDENIEIKGFTAQDGLGIKLLQKTGIEVAIITARKSNSVKYRMESLGIKHVYQGKLDKITVYKKLVEKLNLKDKDVAYMGDDLPDLKPIRQAGLGITVSNAHEFIKPYADYITTSPGGRSAAREVCDLIMKAQGTFDAVYNEFL